MSKEAIKAAIIDSIKSHQNGFEDNNISVSGVNVDNFINEVMSDIERNYDIVDGIDTKKIDELMNMLQVELKQLRQISPEGEFMYTQGKLVGLYLAKELLKEAPKNEIPI